MKTLFKSVALGCLFALALAAPPVFALITEKEATELNGILQKQGADFPLVQVTDGSGTHQFFSQELNRKPMRVGGKFFDAIRFRTPKKPDLDLVWLGMLPDNASSWYIVPVSGQMEGFKNYFDVNGEYAGVPWRWSSKQTIFLQDLSHASLKPDTEYLIWYQFNDDKPALVQGAINFAPPIAKEWTTETLTKTLGLKPLTAEERADRLQTRGTQILRDKNFFGKMAGGEVELLVHFLDDPTNAISIQSNCPFEDAHVSIDAIEKAYGPADVVFYHDQMAKIFPGDEMFTHPTYATYYFDYVGFIVDLSNPRHEVVKDHLQSRDYAVNQKQRPGLTYDTLDGYDFKIFYQDGREIARIARLGEGPPILLSGRMINGTYKQYGRGTTVENEIDYQDGSGVARYFNPVGGIGGETPFKNLVFDGTAKAYDAGGWVNATAVYQNGKLNGPYRLLDKDGKVLKERIYKDGKPVADPQ